MQVNPYLLFNGQCQAAFEHYAQLLGGQILSMIKHSETPAKDHVPAHWQEMIIHAKLAVGDKVLMGSDAPPGRFDQPQGFSVNIGANSVAEAERIFAGLSEGASITMPMTQTFWAERFGMLVDRFGIPWMINYQPPQ